MLSSNQPLWACAASGHARTELVCRNHLPGLEKQGPVDLQGILCFHIHRESNAIRAVDKLSCPYPKWLIFEKKKETVDFAFLLAFLVVCSSCNHEITSLSHHSFDQPVQPMLCMDIVVLPAEM